MIIGRSVEVKAQSNSLSSSPVGQWLMYFGDHRISSKFGLHTEYQARDYFSGSLTDQSLMRLGLNYYIDPQLMLSGGYGFIHTTPIDPLKNPTTSENRLWQQLVFRQRFSIINIEHRYRTEQRFIETKNNGHSIVDHRFRYRLYSTVPIVKMNQIDRHLFVAAYDELFLNLFRNSPSDIFDRNRLYFALGYQHKTGMQFQLGYLFQTIAIPNVVQPLDLQHIQMGIVYNFIPDLGSKY